MLQKNKVFVNVVENQEQNPDEFFHWFLIFFFLLLNSRPLVERKWTAEEEPGDDSTSIIHNTVNEHESSYFLSFFWGLMWCDVISSFLLKLKTSELLVFSTGAFVLFELQQSSHLTQC